MNDQDDGSVDTDGPADRDRDDRTDDQLGPKDASDDATMADMGLGGPPAESATPTGQGEEDGVGASEDQEAGQG